jgi:hypothetical protein
MKTFILLLCISTWSSISFSAEQLDLSGVSPQAENLEEILKADSGANTCPNVGVSCASDDDCCSPLVCGRAPGSSFDEHHFTCQWR